VAYPLIITRRDPAASRPPSAYRLLWHGAYYEVWGRRSNARTALVVSALSGSLGQQCAQIGRLAGVAIGTDDRLVAADPTRVVRVSLADVPRPAGWGRARQGIAMAGPGRLAAAFVLPYAGRWWLWFRGQIMPKVGVAVDGRRLAPIRAQLGGNSLVQNMLTPLLVTLSVGRHVLSLTRGHVSLAPGDGGTAALYAAFLTPASDEADLALVSAAARRWRSLCGRSHTWVEVVPSV